MREEKYHGNRELREERTAAGNSSSGSALSAADVSVVYELLMSVSTHESEYSFPVSYRVDKKQRSGTRVGVRQAWIDVPL